MKISIKNITTDKFFFEKCFYVFFIVLFISCEEQKAIKEKFLDTINVVNDSILIPQSMEKSNEKESKIVPLGDSLTYVYLSQLPQLPLPFRISTEEEPPHTNLQGMNEDIYNRLLYMGTPYGKLMERSKYAVVVHTVPTDMWFPILYTIDFNGQVIDTLNAFECGGSDSDYTCKEYFSVNEDGFMEFVDSTYRYDLDHNGNRIEKSKNLNVTNKSYIINDGGGFTQVESID